MHANKQSQTPEGKKPAHFAAKASARGGGMPAGLLALQSTAGNVAVVQMLRQAGHRWAQPEQHQHGAGCGHQQTEQAGQPAVQRSAVHDVLRSGGRPLDDATRTDMESRLGADFSDVRIHSDSAAKASAAEVGARAYTSGSHVVIGNGGGDRRTLAHELTHVVQQRRGAVAGADNGNGLKVSDPSDRFEREAEANARRVLSGPARAEHSEAVEEPTSVSEHSPHAAGAAPVQRLVSQITPGEDGTVGSVNVVGRPESPYTGTMGDHSTAYVVQVRAITDRIKGQPPGAAAGSVQGLIREVEALPGYQLIDSLPQEQRTKFQQASIEVRARADALAQGIVPAATQMLELQTLVGDFLHFRELVPLSTMNVKSVAPSEAGKGKGESGHNHVLAQHMNNNGQSDPAELQQAILGLLDINGVALVATQHDPNDLASLAPGLTLGHTPEQRARFIIGQHLRSIQAAYPGAVLAAYDDEDRAMQLILAQVVIQMGERMERNRSTYQDKLTKYDEQIRKFLGDRSQYAQAALIEAQGYRRHAAAALEANGGTVPPEPTSNVIAGTRTRKPPERFGSTVTSTSAPAPRLGGGSMDMDMDMDESAETAAGPVSEEETVEAMEAKQPLASQIKMDANGTITAFDSAGRSPSPFPGTMGAHTTAWVVHVDAVRRAIVGRDVSGAFTALDGLTAEAQRTQATMTPLFPIEAAHKEKLNKAHSQVLLTAEQTAGAPEETRVLFLQSLINALLTYLNYIPGATLEAADTGGKAEGTLRNKLLGHEGGTVPMSPDELGVTLLGLLDIKEANPKQRDVLMENHIKNLKHAYPRCTADSNIENIEISKLVTEWGERAQADA
ncbi:eCIS core domain-containing protein [Streptomyces violascens]